MLTTRLEAAGWTLVAVVLATGSVGALLLELYDILSMKTAMLAVTLPCMALLIVLTVVPISRLRPVQDRIRVGLVGGLAGTIGYDLFRIPFAYFGMRVFAPISSYGLLGMGAGQSSGLTTSVGWLYHLSNGLTFGVIYALVASRRSRWFGVLFGVGLEAFAFLSPFTGRYGLTGKWFAIAVAFLAHIAFGLPLGAIVEKFDQVAQFLRAGRLRTALAVVIPAIFIVLNVQPWSSSPGEQRAGQLADEIGSPVAVVVNDRWEPEWLRIGPGGCVNIVNDLNVSFETDLGTVRPNDTTQLCPKEVGAHRVKLNDQPFSGGFVYVDP